MSQAGGTLYLGVGGHVVAIDAATGQEIWRTKLKMTTITTVRWDGRRLYAGAQGQLFCLDAAAGNVLWHNPLKGLGRGIVVFPGSDAESAAGAAAAEAAAAAST